MENEFKDLKEKRISVSDAQNSPLFLVGLIIIIICVFTVLMNFDFSKKEVIVKEDNNYKPVETPKVTTCLYDESNTDYSYKIYNVFTHLNGGINNVKVNYSFEYLSSEGLTYMNDIKNDLILLDNDLITKNGFTSNLNENTNGFYYESTYDLNTFDGDFDYYLNQSINEIKSDLETNGYTCFENNIY